MAQYKFRSVTRTAHFDLFGQANSSDALVLPHRKHTIKTEDLYYSMAADVMEKIWDYAVSLGHKNGIIITGGFRTPAGNASTYGGDKSKYGASQHCAEYYGDGNFCAVDWGVLGWTKKQKKELFEYIIKKAQEGDILFDQLISETRGIGSGWIHISYTPTSPKKNRLQYFYMHNDNVSGPIRSIEHPNNTPAITPIGSTAPATGSGGSVFVESDGTSAYTKKNADDMVERMKIKQITKPTLRLSQMEIADNESDGNGNQRDTYASPQSKIYNLYPMINLNGYNIHPQEIVSFNLECMGFLPRIRYTFTDALGTYKSQYSVDDACVTRLYLRSPGNEDTYKPIRINFDVDKVYEHNDHIRFTVYGTMKIPSFNKKGTNYMYGTSYESLLTLMSQYGLGFASNVENTNDRQIWLLSNGNTKDFVYEIMRHAYIDDDSFVNCFIDPYYNFNFVEMNRLLYQGGEVEKTISFNRNNSDALGDKEKRIDEYRLFNKTNDKNSPFYYVRYELYNSPTLTKENGYKNYIKYWDVKAKCYKSMFVDAITPNSEGMISTVRGNIDGEDDAENFFETQYDVKFISGAADNTHENYAIATVLNNRNMVDLEKCGINMIVPCFNPIITRYSRIWVDVYEKNNWSKEGLKARQENEIIHKDNASVPENEKESGGDSTPIDTESVKLTDEEIRDGLLNKSLSGWYIVKGIAYKYEKYTDDSIQTYLELRRIEREL